eukprot:2012972-Rhodomonas_salina.1
MPSKFHSSLAEIGTCTYARSEPHTIAKGRKRGKEGRDDRDGREGRTGRNTEVGGREGGRMRSEGREGGREGGRGGKYVVGDAV